MTDIRDQLQAALGTTYAVERELGGGGMSRVFLATETALRRRVVIKVLTPELAQGLSAERFAREIQLAAALQEPHIIPVLSTGDAAGLPYYTMPFVEGESLRARLLRGELAYSDAMGILRDVALALEYAHARGIVHRDIKPENVLLSGRTAVVADFGIAKALSAARTQGPDTPSGTLTSIGQSLGTPAYMAPEQATGDPVDHRADLYAWGVMAYELLAGRHPFADKSSTAQLMAAQVMEKPVPLADHKPGLPPPVAALVMRCLEKEPSARIGTATELVHGLDGVNSPSGETTAATFGRTTGAAAPRADAPARRIPALPISLGVVALAVGVVFFALRKGKGSAADEATVAAAVPDTAARGIAVLPFENLGDSSEAYFADGITDAVRTKLVGLRGARVIARGSSNQYRATTKPPAQVAKELGVRYLLTGAVRFAKAKGGSRVQVTPELVELTANGQPESRWTEAFDAEVQDVFTVQGEIAGKVAAAMQIALGGADRTRLAAAPTRDPVAYDLYLRGRAAWNDGNMLDSPAIRRALSYFQQAVRRDSGMAEGWLQVATASSALINNGLSARTAQFPVLQQAIAHATALDRDGPIGHQARSIEFDLVKNDPEGALREAELALRFSPGDVTLLRQVGRRKRALGRATEAVRDYEASAMNDPRSAFTWSGYAVTLTRLRRYDEARTAVERAIALDPLALDQYGELALAYLGVGKLDEARRVLREAKQAVPAAALIAYTAMYNDLGWILPEEDWPVALSLGPESFDDDRGSWALVRAQMYHWKGDLVNARAWGDSAARYFREFEVGPNVDPQVYALRGLALAYAGNKTEAVEEADRATRIGEKFIDQRSYYRFLQARTSLLVGDRAKAMDALEKVLAEPWFVSGAYLRIDPTFKELKGDPRFERLTATR